MNISSDLSHNEITEFARLYLRDIAPLYPYSSKYTIESYIDDHNRKEIFGRLSTLNRLIYKGIVNGNTIGYTMVTIKDGSSIKFGPTTIKKRYRGKGYGTLLRLKVEEVYKIKGIIYSYSTTTAYNLSGISYTKRASYKRELTLDSHFIPGVDELVLRKKIAKIKPKKRIKQEHNNLLMISDIYDIKSFEREINKFGLGSVDSILQNENYLISKKSILFEYSGNRVVLNPKKGNSAQLVIVELELDEIKLEKILDQITGYTSKYYNKLYIYIPSQSLFIDLFIEIGFVSSGRFSKLIGNEETLIEVLSYEI